MPRYKRIREPGLIHHVMSRGNGRMQIFLDDTDYRKFFYLLSDVLDRWQIDCWDACLMPNHYHLAVFNRLPNLPEAMQHLNGEYGTWWNGRHQRIGHVFQGRYKDQIVQHEGYLRNLVRYIAMNPVRAGLVASPELWPWSAYPCIAGLSRHFGFIAPEAVLAEFGDGNVERQRESYMRFVRSAVIAEDEYQKRFRSRQRVLGDRQFMRHIREREAEVVMQRLVVRGDAVAGLG